MNRFQDKYQFQFITISSKRRYRDFDKDKFDIIMFEDIAWGWKGKNIEASKVFLHGGEVYITQADPSKNQSYFDNLKNKSMTVILGFHYGFANFNADEKFLRKNFKIEFNSSHSGNIKKILQRRADISIVTLSFLKKIFKQNPNMQKKLLVSKKFDQHYNHTILLRKNSKFTAREMNTMLNQMENAGVLSRVWAKNGIK